MGFSIAHWVRIISSFFLPQISFFERHGISAVRASQENIETPTKYILNFDPVACVGGYAFWAKFYSW